MIKDPIFLGFLFVALIMWYCGAYKGYFDATIWDTRKISLFWVPFSRMNEEDGKKRYLAFYKTFAHVAMAIILIGTLVDILKS